MATWLMVLLAGLALLAKGASNFWRLPAEGRVVTLAWVGVLALDLGILAAIAFGIVQVVS